MKSVLKAILARTGYRVLRAGALNRFQAIPEALSQLRSRGYEPKAIIDCGANVGDFSLRAITTFPDASVHLIEPQPACLPILSKLARSKGWTLHPYAVGAETGEVRLFVDRAGVTTGAYVATDGLLPADSTEVVKVQMLDELGLNLKAGDRALLKLDLQGWELEALRGSTDTLRNVEIVLCELSFYAQAKEPAIADVVEFLAAADFELYDVAALAGRRRDGRAHQTDFIFARRGSPITQDKAWE